MADTELEIIIKAEHHNSKADLREEKNILENGVDHLILEHSEKQSEYPFRHRWFQILMYIFSQFVMNRVIYNDQSVLKDIADQQNANKVLTRKANSELINDAPRRDIIVSFAVFVGLVIGSILIGLLYSRLWFLFAGGLAFMAGMVAPVMLLRVKEANREDHNRDEKIADKITSAAEKGGRVVAILGNKHCDQVKRKLPEKFDPDIRSTSYSRRHPQQIPRQILNNLKLIIIALPLYVGLYLVVVFILKAVFGSV